MNFPTSRNTIARGMGLMALLFGLASLALAVPEFPRYRDLAIYTTSAPDAVTPAKIVARTVFVNRGEYSLRINVRLQPARALGLRGATYATSLRPGTSAVWTWRFTVPEGFTREVLTGEIALNGRVERDLYLTVLGTDPADLNDRNIEKITERARVVATYTPRQRRSVLAELARQRADRPDPVLTLAAAGKTEYVVLTDALPAPPDGRDALEYWRALTTLTAPQRDLINALDDLRRAVRVKTEAVLPIRARANGPAIILRTADPGPKAKGLQDAYHLRTAGGNIIIEANTPDGLRNGVYGLLTDHLDCRWFQPGQLGEEIGITADHAARLPALDEVQGPTWFSVTEMSWGPDAIWDRRNRAVINSGRMNFGHSWDGYINPREFPFDKYPEYYARDREGNIRKAGTPGAWQYTNFCTTNPEVIEIVARKVNAFFANNPDAIVASLDPNDGSPMCLCDRCLALDKQYGQTREDGGEVSDRLLHFSKEIYDRLEPRFKDRYLGILVYAFQMETPISAKPHPHHAGTVCDMFWDYDHTRPFTDPTSTRNRTFYRQLTAWGSRLSQFGYYEYIGHAGFFGPWALVHKLREDMPAFHALGGTYLHFEGQPFFATQGLNHYIANCLAWNIDAYVDVLLEEFFTGYYGPAAEPMRQYWMGAERLYNLERPGSSSAQRIFREPENWAELDVFLRQAGLIATALPPEQRRFADRVQFARDGFEFGRLLSEYRMKYMDAAVVDNAAAIAYLEQQGPRIDAFLRKYPYGDPYWPTLTPAWARAVYDVDALLKQHQEALNAPAR